VRLRVTIQARIVAPPILPPVNYRALLDARGRSGGAGTETRIASSQAISPMVRSEGLELRWLGHPSIIRRDRMWQCQFEISFQGLASKGVDTTGRQELVDKCRFQNRISHGL
jgi:hypothetical protein